MKSLIYVFLLFVSISSFSQEKSTFDLIFDGLTNKDLKNLLLGLPENQKKEVELLLMKNVADPLYEAGKKDGLKGAALSNKYVPEQYLGEDDDHFITDNLDGEIIKLDDGSIWQVEDSYDYISSIWISMDDVVVKHYKNSTDGYNWKMKSEDDIIVVKLLKQ
ncbi:MAG: hypothetical protein PHP53_07390 [Prolixibacteraceae bacterium]|nr:hypothetical protein [Prolixibacteraceae bacterium]